MARTRSVFWLWFAVAFAVRNDVAAENWPAWRGTHGDGISRETDLPVEWSADSNVRWKVPVPGVGHSSPIVWGDSVFVTSCREDQQQRVLLRLDRRTGRTLWEKTVLVAPLEGIHRLNSRASSTPATDGKRIFVSFLDQDEMFIAAYDFEGNKLWEQRPGVFSSRHGYCTCPVLYKDRLIVNGDHDGEAYIAMLRQDTGETIWKTPRENKTRSYCTPIVVNVDGKDQLMLNGSFCTASYDVDTGKQIWVCDGPSEQMVATLVEGRDMVFSLGGFPEKHLLAIKKGGSGDITKTHIVWRTNQSMPYVPSPLLLGDFLHVVSDDGVYTCFDPWSGNVHVRKRLTKHVSSSIVAGADRIYLSDDAGTTYVLKNGGEGEVLAKNSIGEEHYSTPAIAQGCLFVRGVKHLFCIGSAESVAGK